MLRSALALIALLSGPIAVQCAARGQATVPAARAPTIPEQGATSDEVYFSPEGPLTLKRVPAQLVVRLAADPSGQSLAKFLARHKNLQPRHEITDGGSLYYVVEAAETNGRASSPSLEQFRNDPAVVFAGAVFVDPIRSRRMIPTGQVLVRVRPAVTKADLERAAGEHSLVVAEQVAGAASEYVLRLKDPKDGTVLARARGLRAHPFVEWVQPDFLRELQ